MLKNSFCHPKIKTLWNRKWNNLLVGVECDDEYIGESTQTSGERFNEHLRVSSSIHGHQSTIGHPAALDNFSIVGREGQGFARTIKKSLFIRVNNPAPNRTIGKYDLPHIWDGVLRKTPELQVKK